MIQTLRKTFRPLIILTILTSCSQQISFRDGIVEEQFLYDTASFPSCHASTIAETPAGLVAAFFGGTHERHPDVCIYVCRKESDSWTAPMEVANGIINDTLRYPTWNPVLFQIPDGDLLLFFKIGPKPSDWQGMLARSSDNGKTWTKPDSLPKGYIGPVKNKPVLLADGTLICPSSTENNGWRVHFEYTTDFGKTWSKSDPINDGKIIKAIQPSILTHQDGKLQILCRSKNRMIVQSWSEDNGKTWSLMRESPLPNNNSGTDAVPLGDGRQLLVYNHVKTPANAPKGYRTPLNVAISKDGKSWEAALVLEDSEISQYSYPSVIQSSDGMVHVVYTWRREKIKYVKIDPNKLKSKPIVNEKWPE
jgi:predicted neuraminidase